MFFAFPVEYFTLAYFLSFLFAEEDTAMTEPEYSFKQFLRLQQMKSDLANNSSLYQEVATWLSEGYEGEDDGLQNNQIYQNTNLQG